MEIVGDLDKSDFSEWKARRSNCLALKVSEKRGQREGIRGCFSVMWDVVVVVIKLICTTLIRNRATSKGF